jgi:hypothetical protein
MALGASVGAGLCLVGVWLLGYDFDRRGADVLLFYIIALVFAGLGALIGGDP